MNEAVVIARTLVPFIVTCAVMYLVGSFISVGWDIATWTWELRVLMATFGITFGFALWLRMEIYCDFN